MTMAEGGTMTGTGYTLVIGVKNYSSWSLRPWLALKACGVPFEEERVRLRQPDSKAEIFRHSPSGKVPALKTDIGVIYDSLSIVERRRGLGGGRSNRHRPCSHLLLACCEIALQSQGTIGFASNIIECGFL